MPTASAPPLSDATKAELASSFKSVREQVIQATAARAEALGEPGTLNRCELVAVSKTHPFPVLQAVYDAGCRVFGENYTHEICEKAPNLPQDIQWHFVGHLQSNKVKELLTAVPSLHTLESLDTEKLAKKLNDGVVAQWGSNQPDRVLNVFIQVNTSGEESKSGLVPGVGIAKLAEYVVANCPRLRLRGLMTIGMPDYTSRPENFECLTACRKHVSGALLALYDNDDVSSKDNNIRKFYKREDLTEQALELSMGMSGDFMNAISMGATNVRVGTAIFGRRSYDVFKVKGGPSGNTGDSVEDETK